MPHRAGYFVLAYSWDHHCDDLLRSLKTGFEKVGNELSDLLGDGASTTEELLYYYKKWHYNRDLYDHLAKTINDKLYTIESLGYRGYGVNRDLAGAIGALLRSERKRLLSLLDEAFLRKAGGVSEVIYLPREIQEERNSGYIIAELCKKMGWNPEGQMPASFTSPRLDLDHYFHVMSKETSWQANTAIFQRLFLKTGLSSSTLMTGSAGLHNRRSAGELKTIGNRNFRSLYRYIFDTLHNFTPLGIDLLKRLHRLLSYGIDPEAGEFRKIDFPDRNGVTFEFGNFEREMKDFSWVLSETAQSFHDLPAFIYNLSRSYYMFIGIHPFWDSNGRVGRAFLNQMFLKKGLPPVSFHDSDEIFALPRYGGTMEDMHKYIKARIVKGVRDYFYEREKLESFGFLQSPLFNVSFDSGFTFSQIDRGVRMIEVQFEALVIDDRNPLAAAYREGSRIVLPTDFALYNLSIYCGFSHHPGSPWHHVRRIRHNLSIKERDSEIQGVRVFDVEFMVNRGDAEGHFSFLCCSAAYEEGHLLFDNKGLNYCYRME